MNAQVAITLCVLAAVFGTSSSASMIAPTKEVTVTKSDDFKIAIANIEASFSEIYKSFVLLGDIIILIPMKGTKLVGLEMMELVADIRRAFTDIGGEVQAIGDLLEHFVLHDILDNGTGGVLFIVRTVRKTLQSIKKYLDSV